MLKREELYAQAFENKRKALARKKAEYEMKYAAFCSVEPRLSELDRALAAEGAQTAITALSGNSAALEALKKRINELSDEKKALLKKMGLEDIKYDCPICNDTGYKGGKICECVRDEVKKITVKSLSEEFSIEECRFDNFDLSFYPETADDGSSPHDKMQQLLAFCKDYVKTFSAANSKSLIFLGNTGLGKTHLSFAIVGELLEKGFDVVYGSAYSIFSKIPSQAKITILSSEVKDLILVKVLLFSATL
jgi:DNA replication protein DnaC